MLDSLTVRGFKSIRALEDFKLKPLNVIIGANGSGKSNLLEVFNLARMLREGRLTEYVARAGGAERLLHFGSKVTQTMHFYFVFGRDVGLYHQYSVDLISSGSDGLAPIYEYVLFDDDTTGRPFHLELTPEGFEAGLATRYAQEAEGVKSRMSFMYLYHFHDAGSTSPMKRTADVDDNAYLRSDGSNLASFLYLLSQRHPTEHSLIERVIQRVAPFFDGFTLAPQRLNPDKIKLTWRHKGTDAYFDAAMLSDGTLRFIALATLCLQPEAYRPSVLLLDEPELGLHPSAITLLASLLRQVAATTQVIVSTQSPTLLDHFEPEEVIVAERVDHATTFRRLEAEPLAAWLEDYSLGQLWEKNDLGGRPTSEP